MRDKDDEMSTLQFRGCFEGDTLPLDLYRLLLFLSFFFSLNAATHARGSVPKKVSRYRFTLVDGRPETPFYFRKRDQCALYRTLVVGKTASKEGLLRTIGARRVKRFDNRHDRGDWIWQTFERADDEKTVPSLPSTKLTHLTRKALDIKFRWTGNIIGKYSSVSLANEENNLII